MPDPDLYTSGRYSELNADWGVWDSEYKAEKIASALRATDVPRATICDVGCGAGIVLDAVGRRLPEATKLVGWDLRPEAQEIWSTLTDPRLEFHAGDILAAAANSPVDVVMLIDVIEHMENPFLFLRRIADLGRFFVFHIPLDLSAQTVARDSLIVTRRQVGHLHWFTKSIALEMLADAGYQTVVASFTAASLALPARTRATKLASIPRKAVYRLSPDVASRLLGGCSLLVLATHD